MSMYKELTKYIDIIENDSLGEWIVDRDNDGSAEHPIQMPFVDYSDTVSSFIIDVYQFIDDHPEFESEKYGDILEKNGITWSADSMANAIVCDLDGQCIMALIVGVLRADRFCEGTLLEFLRNGCIVNWLKRLEEL